jgi:hypothetical protein
LPGISPVARIRLPCIGLAGLAGVVFETAVVHLASVLSTIRISEQRRAIQIIAWTTIG